MVEYNFIKECNVFFVLTVNDKIPQGRPFGAVIEHLGSLYISTSKAKEVYKQMIKNSNIQIVAIKPNSRSWIRINALASECNLIDLKSKMLETCPNLKRHFQSHLDKKFAMFKIVIKGSKIYN